MRIRRINKRIDAWRTHSKLCIADAYPVSEGHSLVILRREKLSAQDASISGWAGLLNARGG
jgi:diadenosine tetraphosphate (Ap4A) HIT family hydrolase